VSSLVLQKMDKNKMEVAVLHRNSHVLQMLCCFHTDWLLWSLICWPKVNYTTDVTARNLWLAWHFKWGNFHFLSHYYHSIPSTFLSYINCSRFQHFPFLLSVASSKLSYDRRSVGQSALVCQTSIWDLRPIFLSPWNFL
jgi:hypothetical protein